MRGNLPIFVWVLVGVVLNGPVYLWIAFKHKSHRDPCSPKGEQHPGLPDGTTRCFSISNREREIAELILEGKTNIEIAREKYISVFTVKKHITNLFHKTNSRNRIELINRLTGNENCDRKVL